MKFITLFLNLLLINQVVNSQNSFTAKLQLKKEIIEEEYSDVTLKIYKPKGARNYTVFSQKLPEGFVVKMKDAVGATYSYENNLLTLTWMRCPEENIFTVKYEIASMQGLSGSFSLGGKLVYMAGAQQAVYNLKPQSFTLVKEVKSETKNKLEDTTLKNENVKLVNTKLEGVNCNRKVVFNKKNNYYEVELELISNKKGTYSITEEIPKGFIFLEADSSGAKVKKQSNLVQYIWENISFNNGIIIKYQLIPKGKIINKPSFSGKLSILQGGNIFNMEII